MNRVFFATWAMLMACEAPPKPDSHPKPHREPEKVVPSAPQRPPSFLWRLAVQPSENTAGTTSSRAVELGTLIATDEKNQALLDFGSDVSIEVYENTKAQIGTLAPAELFALKGTLKVSVSPTGNSARPPIRVALPFSTIELDSAAEVLIEVHETGASFVAMLGGAGRVFTELTHGGAADPLEIRSGQAVAINALDSPLHIQTFANEKNLTELRHRAPKRSAPSPKECAKLWTSLEAALSVSERQKQETQHIEDLHRDAIKAHEEGKVRALQRELVQHSRAIYLERRELLTHWERVFAFRQNSFCASWTDPLFQSSLVRVRAALGPTR